MSRALLVRDCFQQAKTIHRLLLVLADDLGDLSAGRYGDAQCAAMSDLVSEVLEPAAMRMREELHKLSHEVSK